MAADNGDNWAKKEEEHPCLSVFIRVLAKVSGSEWVTRSESRCKSKEAGNLPASSSSASADPHCHKP